MSYAVLDLETGSQCKYERVASPFYNKIIAIGLKYPNIQEPETYFQDYMPVNWSTNIAIIIAHNAKFDHMYLWHTPELKSFLARRGKIWCTQLAEYMLTGQQHKYPALRDIAVNKYGCKERVKHIEKYKIGKHIDMSTVPEEEILEDVQNDVLDTEQVALGQVKRAKQLGMYNLIKAEMDGLLATTEMEINGFKVNLETLQNNRSTLQLERDKQYKLLMEIVDRYWR